MRTAIGAILVLCCAVWARAGVLVELTDGTKLTVESYWTDGDRVHLMRGGVDMIVARSRIKSMDEDVADPEVYRSAAKPTGEAAGEPGTAAPQAAGTDEAEGERKLSEMDREELEALHEEESHRLLELQDKRFTAIYGGGADKDEQKAADAAFRTENRRNAEIWFALQKARALEAEKVEPPAAPALPRP